MTARSRTAAVLTAVAVSCLVSACAAGVPGDTSTPSPSASESGLSSGELPILPRPSGPPKRPSDPNPRGAVAGRVVYVRDGCLDVVTDDGRTWSLSGDAGPDVRVGAVVVARVQPEASDACSDGTPALILSVRVVTG